MSKVFAVLKSVPATAIAATITATVTAALLAGCAQEAGQMLDGGSFGDATLNNTEIMNGERQYTVQLARRFAQEVPATVHFAFDSAALDAEARRILALQAGWIRQFPEARFRVYGFTDLVGSDAYNRRLGQRRADAVVAFLTSQGISRARLEGVVSLGKTRPVVNTPGPERANRRAITEVTGFVARHPTLLDGKYAEVIYREYIASAVPAGTVEEASPQDLATQ